MDCQRGTRHQRLLFHLTYEARQAGSEVYTRVETDLVVEVLAGSGRYGTLTVTRMR
ncbi:hypothetical protein ACNPQM_22145 [Streptomyces sp. NPDC056231]|uniref:hypothetical protein n=1 Tax=unclassified Streptomyces TaxID=2593676 RepID=UPI0033CCAFF8